MNDDYSQFFDANSQICLNEDSFVQTPVSSGIHLIALSSAVVSQYNSQTASNSNADPKPKISATSNLINLQDNYEPLVQSFNHHKKNPSIQILQQDDSLSCIDINLKSHIPINESIHLNNLVLDLDLSNIGCEKQNESLINQVENKIEEQIQADIGQQQVNQQKEQQTQNQSKPAANQWQKVTFAKRKSSNNITANYNGEKSVINTNKNSNISSLQSKILMKQNSIPSQIIDYESKSNDYQLSQLPDLKKKKTIKTREPGEILPVFDCLFCCQEHFVLQKINERILTLKYASCPINFEKQRDILMINLLIKSKNPTKLSEVIVYNIDVEYQKLVEKQEMAQFNINVILRVSESLSLILAHSQNNSQSKPVVLKMSSIMKQIEKIKSKSQKQDLSLKVPLINQNVKNSIQIIQSEDGTQKNFFGGLSCVDSMLDQSNFLNVNLRTRRQRVLQNISFETEYHNIYDPCYTSQESCNSVDLEDTESQHFSNEIDQSNESQSEDQECSDDEEADDEDELDYDDEEDVSDVVEIEEEEDEELKEIVQEYNRKEEELKKSPQGTQQIQYVTHEGNNESQNNICGISSIDQQIDEEGFAGSDEEAPTPLTENINFNLNQPTSFSIAEGQGTKLNIQENPIANEEDDDNDSERYTFGCVTPKDEGEIINNEQQKVTFSHGESSLSPVRAQGSKLFAKPQQYQIQKLNEEYYDQQSISQSSHLKNAMLLDISPVSCNRQRVQNYIIDGQALSKDIDMNHENDAIRTKFDFFPSQEIDSLDIHITSVPTLQQQRSFDDSSNFITQQHQPQKKSLIEYDEDSVEFPTQLPFKRLSQYSYDQQFESLANQHSYERIITQCYPNHNIDENIIKNVQELQTQRKSFTTTSNKFNHQRMIPVQQAPKSQFYIDNTPQKVLNNMTLDSQKSIKPQFLSKQEQINETLKKVKFKKKKISKQVNPHNLVFFDSVQRLRLESQMAQQTESTLGQNEELVNIQQLQKQFYKQKTQAVCTPIDTNDNIMLGFGLNGQQTKTNKTTVNQNSRRQNSSNMGNIFLGTCKNGTSSQSNILLGKNLPHPTQLFTNRKLNEFNSTKNITAEKSQAQKNNQKMVEKNYMQFQEQPLASNMQSSTQKNTSMNQIQQTASPSLMKYNNKIFNPLSASINALSHLSVNQLSKKDINQFLRSTLYSSRYASTSTNNVQFNNLFKQSVDMTHYDKISKSNGKKRGKSKVIKTNHTNSITDSKKISKIKKSSKKSKVNKNLQQDYYHQQSQQDFQNNMNVCNSMNFSNDISIPSVFSNGGNMPLALNQKSTSMNSGHVNNKSSQHTLMYQSMQDGKNIFSGGNMCNNTNIQDTSNNYPYGGSLQAEMSTTCISNGCNSNKITHNLNKNNLSNIYSNQQNGLLLQKNINFSTTNKKVKKQSKDKLSSNLQMPLNQDQLHKINSSIEDMNLFTLLQTLNGKKNPKTKADTKQTTKQSKLSQRGSISVQRSQNFNAQSSVEKPVHNRNVCIQDIDPKLQTTNLLVNVQPGHHGQFSFSQNSLKLNQTTNLNKTTAVHAKRKSKGGILNGNNAHVNITSSSSTLKNTSIQVKRRDNALRTRSTSKSNHNIKTDLPTHQLLLQNQVHVPSQILLKNKQILFSSNSQVPQLNLNIAKQNQSKSSIISKNKKTLMISSDQTTNNNQMCENNSLTRQNNSRASNKAFNEKAKQLLMGNGLAGKNYQDMGKLYGTSKILMSQVTSPLRPLANNVGNSIGYSLNLGHVNNISLGGVKGELFQTNFKESIDLKK